MSSIAPPELPHPQVCERARRSRDARFDGVFFTAVRSTGIYCRPVCPAPPAKAVNVDYYASAAAAEAAGFRPCLRCRPELAPGDGAWRRSDQVLARALRLIEQGFLDEQPMAAMARRLHLGERQLRRLFVQQLGAPPVSVNGTRRLLFAKQLLTETGLPVTAVAMAAGFGSLRRFNDAFIQAYALAPRDLRRQREAQAAQAPGTQPLVLKLAYRPPYDFPAMLGFLRGRALPGMEQVDDQAYQRSIGTPQAPGWLRVSAWPGPVHALRLELHAVPPGALADAVRRVRRMFDLDADPAAIAQVLEQDRQLAPLLQARPGLRLPSGWDGLEIAVRAVIGQQVSVAAARTVATRVLARLGTPLPPTLGSPSGLTHRFPDAPGLATADLCALGLTGRRAACLQHIARAVHEGELEFRSDQALEAFTAAWTRIPGVGPWTANYLAMRAMGHPDALPAQDLVLLQMLRTDSAAMTPGQLRTRAQAWRPWRSYAVIHLWTEAASRARPAPARSNGQ
jgi:AraC family transcriptional regulator of adaptative response / DNA-3-methyladenine glycosylase II